MVLQALEETEQALATYGAELDRRQALADAQDRAHEAFELSRDQLSAGALTYLDLLTTEQSWSPPMRRLPRRTPRWCRIRSQCSKRWEAAGMRPVRFPIFCGMPPGV